MPVFHASTLLIDTEIVRVQSIFLSKIQKTFYWVCESREQTLSVQAICKR